MLYPGLRIGCAVVPAAAVELFVARHEASYRGPGALEQRALALFLAEGHFERHLARLRAHNAERQAALLAALAAELGTVVSARPAAAGHAPRRADRGRLALRRRSSRCGRGRSGVAVEPLSFSRRLDAGDRELRAALRAADARGDPRGRAAPRPRGRAAIGLGAGAGRPRSGAASP